MPAESVNSSVPREESQNSNSNSRNNSSSNSSSNSSGRDDYWSSSSSNYCIISSCGTRLVASIVAPAAVTSIRANHQQLQYPQQQLHYSYMRFTYGSCSNNNSIITDAVSDPGRSVFSIRISVSIWWLLAGIGTCPALW